MEFDTDDPELGIQILGVNEAKLETGNGFITRERDIPWLQDGDEDGDGKSDIWDNLWNVEWRDVIVLDANNERAGVFNLTNQNLALPDNYNALKQMLMDAAAVEFRESARAWQNPDNPLDVDKDGSVLPNDALYVVNAFTELGSHHLDSSDLNGEHPALCYDASGDGYLSPIDARLVIDYLNDNLVLPEMVDDDPVPEPEEMPGAAVVPASAPHGLELIVGGAVPGSEIGIPESGVASSDYPQDRTSTLARDFLVKDLANEDGGRSFLARKRDVHSTRPLPTRSARFAADLAHVDIALNEMLAAGRV